MSIVATVVNLSYRVLLSSCWNILCSNTNNFTDLREIWHTTVNPCHMACSSTPNFTMIAKSDSPLLV